MYHYAIIFAKIKIIMENNNFFVILKRGILLVITMKFINLIVLKFINQKKNFKVFKSAFVQIQQHQ